MFSCFDWLPNLFFSLENSCVESNLHCMHLSKFFFSIFISQQSRSSYSSARVQTVPSVRLISHCHQNAHHCPLLHHLRIQKMKRTRIVKIMHLIMATVRDGVVAQILQVSEKGFEKVCEKSKI